MPVVATEVGRVIDIVENNKNGILVPRLMLMVLPGQLSRIFKIRIWL